MAHRTTSFSPSLPAIPEPHEAWQDPSAKTPGEVREMEERLRQINARIAILEGRGNSRCRSMSSRFCSIL